MVAGYVISMSCPGGRKVCPVPVLGYPDPGLDGEGRRLRKGQGKSGRILPMVAGYVISMSCPGGRKVRGGG